MADASVTYEVKGTSDVQEQTDKAQKAMGQMEKAIEGLNKKMSTWGKDLILSYIAPMVLLNKAIDYIAASIEKQRQAVADAVEFTRKGESKELDPAFVYLARKRAEQEQTATDKEKAKVGRQVETEKFLENASEQDMQRLFKRLGPGSELLYNLGFARRSAYAEDTSIQNAVRDIQNADRMREEEERNKGKGPGGIDTMAVQNAVFGMGTSPIITSMQEQLDVQRTQADTLRRIEERLPPREEDYTRGSQGTPYRPTITFR
jgi:hypothetical protein